MFERICPKCNVPMVGDKCIKESCGRKTVTSSTIYWCDECNVPIFDKICPVCGTEGVYTATDIRPVFPEERLLIGILTKRDNPLCYMDKSVMKVSGCFRTEEGPRDYLKIMSYIGTAHKQGYNAYEAIRNAISGTPDFIFG